MEPVETDSPSYPSRIFGVTVACTWSNYLRVFQGLGAFVGFHVFFLFFFFFAGKQTSLVLSLSCDLAGTLPTVSIVAHRNFKRFTRPKQTKVTLEQMRVQTQ